MIANRQFVGTQSIQESFQQLISVLVQQGLIDCTSDTEREQMLGEVSDFLQPLDGKGSSVLKSRTKRLLGT